MYDELTEVDIKKMQEEIDYRMTQLRPKLIEDVKTAREWGDLSENFEYKAAKREKNRNDSRIRYLERMIKTAKVVPFVQSEGIGLFDTVVLWMENLQKEQTVRLATALRQDAMHGIISKEGHFRQKGRGPGGGGGRPGAQLLGGDPQRHQGQGGR